MGIDATGETRTVTRLSLGAKVCLVIASLFLIAAGYRYFVPIDIPATQGVFGCGSAAQPPSTDFARGTCASLPGVNALQALLLLIGAVVVGGAGFTLFGTTKHREWRVASADPQ